jgi:hypothetical protein
MTTISVIVGSTASRSFAFTGRLLTGDIFLSDLSKIPAVASEFSGIVFLCWIHGGYFRR